MDGVKPEVGDWVEYQPNVFNPRVKKFRGQVESREGDCFWVRVSQRSGRQTITSAHRQYLKKIPNPTFGIGESLWR